VTHTPSGTTRAGASQSNAEYFNGSVDEVKIYESALSEKQVAAAARVPANVNVAPWATATASTETTGGEKANVADGVIGAPASGSWITSGTDNAPSVTLAWPEAVVTDKVVLYDLPGTSDRVTSGKLIFSDGTWESVAALPNDGTAQFVTFSRRATTSVRFEILTHSGSAGLSELQVFEAAPDYAMSAEVTASTEVAGATAELVADGNDPTQSGGAWKATTGDTVPWLKLTWPSPQKLDHVVLYDRAGADRVTAGKLKFSDGTVLDVPALPDGGGRHVVAFPERSSTSVTFEITTHTGEAGLAELQAYDMPELASSASVTASSMFNSNYAPTMATDGIIGSHGTGEWAVLSSDANKTIRLTWPSSQVVGSVTLYDRVNGTDQVKSGVITFSDGSTPVNVSALPNDGKGHTVVIPPRNVTWIEFQISTFSGLPGLSEIQVN